MANALVLMVPGLLARPEDELATMPSLAAIARDAAAPRHEPRGIAEAMLAALGAPATTPIGPLAMLGAGADPGNDYVLCADPVELAVDRDTVFFARTVDDLSADESTELIRMLDRHFAGDDLRFEAVRPDAWYARCSRAPRLVTTPPDAARGRNLFRSLPAGADGAKWKRWQNEIEMLLHEHAINAEREARGAPIVSDVWFWGGGALTDAGTLPGTDVACASGRLSDLARGIARSAGSHETALTADDDLMRALSTSRARAEAAQAMLVIVPDVDASKLESEWLAPARAELSSRRIDSLVLIADGIGGAFSWTARRSGFFRRLAARVKRTPFTIPASAA